ncbi:MAG: hypothetical protein IPP07_13665 [Holophagales bacterium]|nr:hypothetical protein [Holophagales bacterium]MBK9965886.1 hypothetical protein [Holophagales bacterium]
MKVPGWSVPALVVLLALAGLGGARLFAVPSVVVDLPAAATGATRTTVLVVDGVKCVDTAERAAGQVKGLTGVSRFVAYASRNRVEVTFDPAVSSSSKIVEAIEGPVHDAATGEYLFHVYHVVEIDGAKVPTGPPATTGP